MSVNSKKVRRHGGNPELKFTEEDFLHWLRAQCRECCFCGISEQELEVQGIKSSIGLTVAALGIDRLDHGDDYTLENIALCCYACNKTKGNVFTTDEMLILGRAIAEVWQLRGASRGGAW